MRLRSTIVATTLIFAAGFTAVAWSDPPEEAMQIVRESDIEWKQDKIWPRLQTAVVAGDPSKPGIYVVRAKFSPGTMSSPHFHPDARYIAVLKGTWWVGAGTKWDRDATTPVHAGSFVVHHPNQVHYDGAKDEEVHLQIVGMGPSATTPVDESGQPKQ